ncbi:uncharacterized protein LOC115696632 [Cannabis sativa]|uniref:uncharacterized protein LOC115696632 n=1 Tax=Cannabis sativa TaxID=3483 RepID=UPI0011DF67E1|nr:uncharacterized protein LOC115696632 [Cannabis sativa]
MGDFNDYINLDDKIGGDTSRTPSGQFQNFLDSFALHALSFTGNPFTWTNKQNQQFHTQEHIDWGISNTEWDSLFPKHHLLHGDYFGSDHRPLILNLHHTPTSQNHNTRFFFDKLWLSEPDFEDCLRHAWTSNLHSNTTDYTLRNGRTVPILTLKSKEMLSNSPMIKPPGSDGFHDTFFQKNWHIVGHDVLLAAKGFLNGDANIGAINHTVIVLIPKHSHPQQVTDYRPISLCTTLYKIISRVLANRLKPILSRIISPTQSAFLPDRLISDNIIISQEVFHALSHRKNGRTGWMAIKLDMAKAFDRVEWRFIRQIMSKFNFPARFINLVMACISTVSFSFSINHQVLGRVIPSRGIHQGDPLSPYLFLLCSEGLSSLISQKTLTNNSRNQGLGLKISHTAPIISHLFFADDSLLFNPSSPSAATTIKDILQDYSSALGQMVNYSKSSLFFSPNTNENIKIHITSVLGIPIRNSFEKYLGLPQTFGRTKKEVFNYLKDHVWSHLNKWNSKHFSKGGKEILLKAVVQAIPSYAMSCFKLPASFHSKIESMMPCFWWGGTESNRKNHWKKWSSLSRSKFHGGLGFRSMKAFNQAMLAKQAWRLLQAPHSLVATILKACRPSLVWISVSWGKELLVSGLRKSIGNGASTSIYNDAWIPGYGKVNYLKHLSDGSSNVSNLITPSHQWDSNRIRTIFPVDISQAIESIPLLPLYPDTYYWPYTTHGNYSVNTGYHKAHSLMSKDDPTPSDTMASQTWWKKMWTQTIPPKVKLFIWRTFYDILPKSYNLHKRKSIPSPNCCRCQHHMETLEHAIFRCLTVQKVWKLTQFSSFIFKYMELTCREIVHVAASSLTDRDYQFFLCLLWKIWHCRNDYLHHQKLSAPAHVIQSTSDYLDLYQQNNRHSLTSGTHPSYTVADSYEAPSSFNLKLSVNAAQNTTTNKTGFGMALFNNMGDLLLGANHHLLLNRFAKDIKNFLSYLPNATFVHISREQNEDAHRLAKFSLGLDQEESNVLGNFYSVGEEAKKQRMSRILKVKV